MDLYVYTKGQNKTLTKIYILLNSPLILPVHFGGSDLNSLGNLDFVKEKYDKGYSYLALTEEGENFFNQYKRKEPLTDQEVETLKNTPIDFNTFTKTNE